MNFSADNTKVPLKHADQFFINGAWVAPTSDKKIVVTSSATEETYMEVAEAQLEDVNRAVAAAREAFDHGPWPRMSHQERAGYLRAMAKVLAARAGDISVIWPNEMGITHPLAGFFASTIASAFESYASLAESFSFEKQHPTYSGAELGLLVREPVGVVGAIIPWNGPILLMSYKVAPALLAGCTMVIKASPEAPGHALLMAEVAEAAGLPPGVLNVITADRKVSEALVRHPDIDKIAFTGSSVVGKKIAAILADRMGRFTLELGGKSAAIVLDDYDVELAAQVIAGNTCAMSGQMCAALTRIIVPKDKHDRMLEALASAFAATKVGDPFDSETQMGPLATSRHRARVEQYIQLGKDQGLTLATGGGRPMHLKRGFYVEPTVFGNVDNRSVLAQEEIFGPVLTVIPALDEEDAVDIANDSVYGLNGSVFTHDVNRAYAIARRLRTGTVGHNNLRVDFSIGFGGFKESGIGREGGVGGLYPYLESKTVLLDGLPDHRF